MAHRLASEDPQVLVDLLMIGAVEAYNEFFEATSNFMMRAEEKQRTRHILDVWVQALECVLAIDEKPAAEVIKEHWQALRG